MWKYSNEHNPKRNVRVQSFDSSSSTIVLDRMESIKGPIELDTDAKRLFHDIEIPKHLLDPIHRRFMEDPVALSSGYIFDRSTILDNEGMLKYDRCPISGKVLDCTTMIPLPSIKKETFDYLEHREKTSEKDCT
jgi:U-box domain.